MTDREVVQSIRGLADSSPLKFQPNLMEALWQAKQGRWSACRYWLNATAFCAFKEGEFGLETALDHLIEEEFREEELDSRK